MAISNEDIVRQLYKFYLNRMPSMAEIQAQIADAVRRQEGVSQYIARIEKMFGRPFDPSGLLGAGAEQGGGFHFPAFEVPGPSAEETRYLNLLGDQIAEQLKVTKAENARVEARRTKLNEEIMAKYGIGLEEFEAQEALRAANISRTQSERLEKALKGELDIDPSLEEQITKESGALKERMLEQLGPGWETSTPGIQAQEEFRKGSEALRYAARRGEIEGGIAPAAATTQYGLSVIGAPRVADTTGIAQALQAATNQRAASIEAARARSAYVLGQQELLMRGRIASMEADLLRQRYGAAQPQGDVYGRGVGSLVGSGVGAAAGYYFSGDPFGA